MAKAKQNVQGNEKPYKFFLNGEPIDRLPQEALDAMSERLSRVVSRYFSQHPDEYEAFLREQEMKKGRLSTSV